MQVVASRLDLISSSLLVLILPLMALGNAQIRIHLRVLHLKVIRTTLHLCLARTPRVDQDSVALAPTQEINRVRMHLVPVITITATIRLEETTTIITVLDQVCST